VTRSPKAHNLLSAQPPELQEFRWYFAISRFAERTLSARASHDGGIMARMTAEDSRVTYAELLQWPEDGRRYELYDGEVIVVPLPLLRHQRVAMHIGNLLVDYERATGGLVVQAPFDIVFSQYDVLEPDLVFFGQHRRHLLDMMDVAYVAPDLAVEVLSRSTERRDRGRKQTLFAQYGVGEYWIVDPVRNTLEIYRLTSDQYELTAQCGDRAEVSSPTLDGLLIRTADIFAE
jgi:Uma2 family endonuclease